MMATWRALGETQKALVLGAMVVLVRAAYLALFPENALTDYQFHLQVVQDIHAGVNVYGYMPTPLFHVLGALVFFGQERLYLLLINLFYVFAAYRFAGTLPNRWLGFSLIALNPVSLIYGVSFYPDLLAAAFVLLAGSLVNAGKRWAVVPALAAAFTKVNAAAATAPYLLWCAARSGLLEKKNRLVLAALGLAFLGGFLYLATLVTGNLLQPSWRNLSITLPLSAYFLLPALLARRTRTNLAGFAVLAGFSAYMFASSLVIEARYLLPFLPYVYQLPRLEGRKKQALLVHGLLGFLGALLFLGHFRAKLGA